MIDLNKTAARLAPPLLTVLLGLAVVPASPALAQAPATPPQTSTASKNAQLAFDAGMELMKAERYAEACIKLEESQRIEAGMGTQFRLAQCYEKVGRFGSAWKHYDAVATAARAARLRTDDAAEKTDLEKREKYSQGQADALVPKVARAALRIPSDVVMLPGLAVTINGEVIAPASWGSVPLDKGVHRIVVQAKDKRPFEAELTVAEDGERIALQVPPLQDAAPDGDDDDDGNVVIIDSRTTTHPVMIAGIVVGLVGLAGMGAGVGVGFAAKGRHDESDPMCSDDLCTQEGLDIRSDARSLGDIGTGVVIGGGVLAAAGLGLFIAGIMMGSGSPPEQAQTGDLEFVLTPTGGSLSVVW